VLYPKAEKEQVQQFIEAELQSLCSGGKLIHDRTGFGGVAL
jgi:hypothetical protein